MESSTIYGLESQGRSLCSDRGADCETIRFFLGTLLSSHRSTTGGTSNSSPAAQVHQLDFDDELNLVSKKVYKPKGVQEVWQLSASPNSSTSSSLLAIVHNHITENSCQLRSGIWKLPTDNSGELELECDLHSLLDESLQSHDVRSLDWHPTRPGTLATLLKNHAHIWDIHEGHPQLRSTYETVEDEMEVCKWNPHLDGNQLGLISGTNCSGLDLRSMKEAWRVRGADKYQVRDMDFNPNKQYYFATVGNEAKVVFWDNRNTDKPLKVLDDNIHSHWIWRVRYNTYHDQLILTAGSDSRVILHSIPSISSEPKGRVVFSDSEEDEASRTNSTPLEEGILGKYEEHEDAVYALEWSNSDPWTFASLSYDGRLVINRVPKSLKYQIIL